MYAIFNDKSFNYTLTNDIVSFEQLGPECYLLFCSAGEGLSPISYTGPSCSKHRSLTSSLRVISLTVLADSIHNILIFFAEKM